MTCSRCGERDQPGVHPDVHVDTVSVRVNETVELMRVPLCSSCRTVLTAAMQEALTPARRPAA